MGRKALPLQLFRTFPLVRRVGFGNTGDSSCPRSNASNQNALLGYGPTTARHYNADYQVIAWSGAGVNVYPNTRCSCGAGTTPTCLTSSKPG